MRGCMAACLVAAALLSKPAHGGCVCPTDTWHHRPARTSDTLEDFLSWARTNGADVHGVRIGPSRHGGHGVFSVHGTPAPGTQGPGNGHLTAAVPAALRLSGAHLRHIDPRLAAAVRSLPHAGTLGAALALMHERLLGTRSFWAPYIRTLPGCVPSPAFCGPWFDVVVNGVRGHLQLRIPPMSSLALMLHRQRAKTLTMLAAADAHIFRSAHFGPLFGAGLWRSVAGRSDLRACLKWAVAMVASRGFPSFFESGDVLDQKGFVPVIGMNNHHVRRRQPPGMPSDAVQSRAPARPCGLQMTAEPQPAGREAAPGGAGSEAGGGETGRHRRNEFVASCAVRRVHPGEEITHYYDDAMYPWGSGRADITNSEFLANFGFAVVGEAVHECCSFSLQNHSESVSRSWQICADRPSDDVAKALRAVRPSELRAAIASYTRMLANPAGAAVGGGPFADIPRSSAGKQAQLSAQASAQASASSRTAAAVGALLRLASSTAVPPQLPVERYRTHAGSCSPCPAQTHVVHTPKRVSAGLDSSGGGTRSRCSEGGVSGARCSKAGTQQIAPLGMLLQAALVVRGEVRACAAALDVMLARQRHGGSHRDVLGEAK